MRHWLAALTYFFLIYFGLHTAWAQNSLNHNIAQFKSESVLKEGFWYKIRINKEGIYQISYNKLKDIGFSNPAKVMVYTGENGMLAEQVDSLPRDGLYPVPVRYKDERLIFYGQGTDEWSYRERNGMFRVKPHVYASANTYFLYQAGDRALHVPEIQDEEPKNPVRRESFVDYAYHEQNDTNLIKSGREWYGERFDAKLSYDFNFPMRNQTPGSSVSLYAEVIARSDERSNFYFDVNGKNGSISLNPVNFSYTATVAREGSIHLNGKAAADDNVHVNIRYGKPSQVAEGWLNRITVNARRNLVFTDNELFFSGVVPGENDGISYKLRNAPENVIVWDVTDPFGMEELAVSANSGFTVNARSRKGLRMVAFDPKASFASPEFEGPYTGTVDNQDLHSDQTPELVIVTHHDFIQQAKALRLFHKQDDKLTSRVYTVEQIYNEFSGGKPDAAAIRNMLRMFYSRESGGTLKYLVLMGDGSYDNQSLKPANTNFIPTYQSVNSLSPTGSFVTDDFYGLLDIGEGGSSGQLDIGIGRLPVQTPEEAQVVVNKIKTYKNQMAPGLWRNQLCFAGDDEDGNLFMYQANELAKRAEQKNSGFVQKKILLDAYQQETTSSQESYPGATRDLNDLVQNGVLMVNYVGHGAEDKLAEENLLQLRDIRSWTNSDKLTVFITATCEFSRFDDYRRRSAGEEMLLNPKGGAVALFSTTRLVWAGENYNLNKKFINHAFERDSAGELLRMGDIIRRTKIDAGSGKNKRNFMLLGHPALKLAYAKHQVHTDSVNGYEATKPDTVGAMEFVKMKGHIADGNGEPLNNFNGVVYASVYDKAQTMQTLGNDGGEPFEFESHNNLLYKGKATVSDGQFSIGFYVPRDIQYAIGNSKISYYAVDTLTNAGAMGGYHNLCIGGSAENPVVDEAPPQISLYLNSPEFASGDAVNATPVLIAEITDDTGINTTKGIGHGISMVLDDERENTVMLNNYFEASLDNHRKGKVEYKLGRLKPGKHTLEVKAWDIANNSAQKTIRFKVVEASTPRLTELKNYPNPFQEQTRVFFKHNLAGTSVTAEMRIFNRYGQLVKQDRQNLLPDAYYVDDFTWNGRDAGGNRVPDGIYFYKIILINDNGQQTSQAGKMLFLHP